MRSTPMAVLAALSAAACASSKHDDAPPTATMTSTGGTEINRTDDTDAPLVVVAECKKVVSCYNALARDLCLQSTKDCSASFQVTMPIDKPETCKRLLDQAEETAKPFIADKEYEMPTECD